MSDHRNARGNAIGMTLHRRALSSSSAFKAPIHYRSASATSNMSTKQAMKLTTQPTIVALQPADTIDETIEGYAGNFFSKIQEFDDAGRMQRPTLSAYITGENRHIARSQSRSLIDGSNNSNTCHSQTAPNNASGAPSPTKSFKKHPSSPGISTYLSTSRGLCFNSSKPVSIAEKYLQNQKQSQSKVAIDNVQNSESTIAMSSENIQTQLYPPAPTLLSPHSVLPASTPSLSMPSLARLTRGSTFAWLRVESAVSSSTCSPVSALAGSASIPGNASSGIAASAALGTVTTGVQPWNKGDDTGKGINTGIRSTPRSNSASPVSLLHVATEINHAAVRRLESCTSVDGQGRQYGRGNQLVPTTPTQRLLEPITGIDGLTPIATQPDTARSSKSSINRGRHDSVRRGSAVTPTSLGFALPSQHSFQLLRSVSSDNRQRDDMVFRLLDRPSVIFGNQSHIVASPQSSISCDMAGIDFSPTQHPHLPMYNGQTYETTPPTNTVHTTTTEKKRESIQKRIARLFRGHRTSVAASASPTSDLHSGTDKHQYAQSRAEIPHMFLLGGSPTTRRDITTTYQMTTDHSVNADEPKAVHFLGNPAARHASRVRYTPRIEPTPRIARNTDLKSQPPPFPPTKPGHIPTPTIVTTGLGKNIPRNQGVSPNTFGGNLAKDTHDGLEQRSAHHEPSTPQKGLGKLDRNNRSAGHRVVRSSAGNPNSDETLEKSRYKLPKALAIFQKRSKSEDLDSNALSERSPLRSSSYSSSHRIVETSVIYSKNESQDTVISPTGEPEHAQGRVNQYHILKDIGIGAFGRVTLVRSELTAKYYACKVISKNRLRKKFRWTQGGKPSPQSPTPTSGIDDELMASIKREVAVLKKLSEHPNIVNLVEVLDDAMEDNLYIIFDLCEYGPVMEITVGEPTRPLSEELARKYFRDVVLGLEYLHYKRIIHRDIKPENLLRTAENVVQIGDFGISHMFDDGDNEGLLVSKNGSPLYSPPEACSAETKVLNGKSLDIWSLGVTLYCFVHGTCPWEDTNIVELCRKICQDDYTTLDCLSNDLKDLLSKMMDKNPNTRIQMSQIKIHPWVTENGRDPLLSTDANCVYEDVTEEEVAHAFRPALRFVNKMMKKLKSRSKTSKHKHPTVSPNTREYTDKNLATPKTSARTFSAIAKGGPVLSEPNLRQHGQDQSNSDLSSRGSVQRRSVGDCEADLAEDFQNRTRQLLFDIDYGDGSITWSNYMSVDLSMAAALNHNSSVNTSHTHAFDSNSKSANQSHKQGHGKFFSFHSRHRSS
ncbi:hypothetical protein BASA50_008104 [Batrachochytrium salamandrivorans]|uniref:Protein kinase domain-containing protein n=1 Tax=Batrachochytrium salamandrivorans TaxID=1357716 RepID=A0ABQ8F5A3_9FUNG|nr:hypothetical protein BASA50_008104 [Batrachochytrium salamandrivorans]KAH9274419.1 hypothetical protein BASA83_003050 [Batrachochytrium salamandrivorans]